SGLPNEIQRPYTEPADYYDAVKEIRPLLEDPQAVEKLVTDMEAAFRSLSPEDRMYEYRKDALRDMTTFRDGSFSLFSRAARPAPVLQTRPRRKQDAFDDIHPAEVREHLKESGIVDGTVVDPEKLENTPLIQQITEDVERLNRENAAEEIPEPEHVQGDEESVMLPSPVMQIPDTDSPDKPKPQNFRITDDHLGEGGPKAKFAANLAAIETMQRIQTEGDRPATPEEQDILARYVGWGGLAEAFDPEKEKWAKEYTRLKELLPDPEYKSARASVLNAHYTSPTVIRAMYQAMAAMGFQTGNLLDPGLGVGNFFGMLPEEMSGSRLYGAELDPTTGRIARKLYPNAHIQIMGYEKTSWPDHFFDAAVGNVPFGA
ncbi:MAG: hypothetical protein AAGU02_09645, partial [Lawsonibacter sp.]